ncbi:MAG TPA: DUF3108 domain-containing protein [Bdellovibrio sp.]
MKFSGRQLGTFIFLLMLVSCSSVPLKYEKAEELKKNEEFEKAVTIVTTPEATTEAPAPSAKAPSPAPPVKKEAKKSVKAKKATKPVAKNPVQPTTEKAKEVKTTETKVSAAKEPSVKKATPAPTPTASPESTPATGTEKPVTAAAEAEGPDAAPSPTNNGRLPDIEDGIGFNGRRPIKDPFRVGEEVVHDVHYFKVSAGELRLKVEPFAMVNNRKSYRFAIEIKTSPLFETFYSVDDRAETFVDYETLVPSVFQMHVKESGQLREAKMLFDNEKNTATFWEKKVTKEHGEEEKRQHWDILEYTQNIYSAIFYMRNFQWETGKEYAFRVANDNENLVFSGKALRREVLKTKLGPMKAIVVQPTFFLKGKFKPIGDNFIWLSDDDRRLILRIESKIKIGTLVSEVIEIK